MTVKANQAWCHLSNMDWLLLTIFWSFKCLERNAVVCILCPKGLSPRLSVWTLSSGITYQQQLLGCRSVTETLKILHWVEFQHQDFSSFLLQIHSRIFQKTLFWQFIEHGIYNSSNTETVSSSIPLYHCKVRKYNTVPEEKLDCLNKITIIVIY